MIRFDPISRRHFLLGTGKFALALPFLSSMWPEKLWAGQGRKKFVGLVMYCGTRYDQWDPTITVEDVKYNFGDVRIRPLTDSPAEGLSQIVGSSFNPYLSKMNYLKGLDVITNRGHNDGDIALGNLSATEDWETIDQIMAGSKSFYGNQIPSMDSMYISVASEKGLSRRKVGPNIVQIPPMGDPQVIFDRIFYASTPADRTKNMKVVDRVIASYQSLKTNSRLSTVDKQTIQNFIDRLNDTQNKLLNQRPLEGAKPATRPIVKAGSTKDYYRSLVELAILALQTECTQVLTMGIHSIPLLNEADGFATPPAGVNLDSRGTWHETHHLPDGLVMSGTTDQGFRNQMTEMLIYQKWHAENAILPFIKGMDSITEANGKTMLDNSLVLWGNELGYWHSTYNMPVMLFGSAGGTIATNRYLDYSRRETGQGVSVGVGPELRVWRGQPYNRLLVSIMQTMGLTAADYERNGVKGYGAYNSLNPDTNAKYASTMPMIDQMLPRFKA